MDWGAWSGGAEMETEPIRHVTTTHTWLVDILWQVLSTQILPLKSISGVACETSWPRLLPSPLNPGYCSWFFSTLTVIPHIVPSSLAWPHVLLICSHMYIRWKKGNAIWRNSHGDILSTSNMIEKISDSPSRCEYEKVWGIMVVKGVTSTPF